MTDESAPDKSDPLVSIIMAACNCAAYVGEAIESSIQQTYENWELLCIDDGSTDGTRDIVRHYIDRDERIRLICNEENLGAAGARNRGIEQARGEFIAILDADDVSLPDRLARSIAAFSEHPEVALVGSGATLIDSSRADRGVWYKHDLVHSSVMIRTGALREVGGYDEFFRYGQDKDLYYRLSLRHPFYLLDEPLVKYRWTGRQMSGDHSLEQRAYGRLAGERARAAQEGEPFDLAARYEELLADPGLRADCAYNIGWSWLIADEPKEARARFLETLRITPTRVGATIWYLLSFMPGALRRIAINHWFAIKHRTRRRRTGVISWPC